MIDIGQEHRGPHRDRNGHSPVLVVAVALAVALVMIGVAVALTNAQTVTPSAGSAACPSGTQTSGSQQANLCVEIGEYDIYFKPNQITIPADTPVRVVLVNHGVILHDFSITNHNNAGLKNLNISILTEPGKTNETTINAPEGTYYFFCNQPGHEQAGMFGYLTVKKDATITASEATVTPRAG